ncbi:biotin--[acetyl-CoA-carboxylase] ligase [Dyadobacter flavalbus]|uniref:Biotin--[acetyl-CoA-carboxylase] ligase n=1 Tax=Dyadobacter flavalbus TaxID=2579942 RepID=A0A5M8QY02_9BACT|nr:biotin--[acetyl-CoA-carboxylase] ligase [Dyadobacter flavalbus]KAA6441069.1 biotin--[acetyl-CoA-carboxylase] ligase [Dyadobacter flavalbus]
MYNSIQDTLIIGKKVIYLPSCHSTNDIAAEIVHAGLFAEGTIVITDNQIKGKGQRGTIWQASSGENLTFSVMLAPSFITISEQFLISQVIALAIRAYLSQYVEHVKIKWPNDIYVNNRKVCGILIENSIQGTKIAGSIVGIGLNVNQIEFENSNATSLSRETGNSFVLTEEFQKVLTFLDVYYQKMKSLRRHNDLRQEYLSHLYGYNETVTFNYQNRIVKGTVTGVTAIGKIMVKLENEPEILELGLKEIEWIIQ